MRLCEGIPNHTYLIKGINFENTVRLRLETIGVYKGSMVRIWKKKHSGTMIIKIYGTRWAIGKTLTLGIEVEEDMNND